MLVRNKHHIGAFPGRFHVWLAIGFPLAFRHRLHRLAKRRTHPRSDPKSDKALRSIRPLFVAQPIDQLVLVARRIASKVVLGHGGRQGRERSLRHRQTLIRRRHVSVPELIGQHQVHLRPNSQHRLVPALAFVASQRFLFAALDDGGILVYGRDLLGCATPPNLLDQVAIHLSQSAQRRVLAGNISHRSQTALLFGGFDLARIMELIQKVPGGCRRWELMSQGGRQSRVGPQLLEVLQALSSHPIQKHEAFHERGLVVAAFPLFDADVARDALRHAQGSQGTDQHRRSAVRCQPFRGGLGIDFKEELALGGGGFRQLTHSFKYAFFETPTGDFVSKNICRSHSRRPSTGAARQSSSGTAYSGIISLTGGLGSTDLFLSPFAANSALAMAGATNVMGDSPAPTAGISRRQIRSIVMSGMSRKRGTRYCENRRVRWARSSNSNLSHSAPPMPCMIAPCI